MQDDPRKFRFIERVRHVRDLFRGEVHTVVAMCAQFSDALHVQLRAQAMERVVSRDEHAVKSMNLVGKFRKVLDVLLEQTRALVLKMHKSFLSIYNDKPDERAVRTLMPLTYGEAMFATVSGGGGSHKRVATGGRGATKANAQVTPAMRQQERDEWMLLWNDKCANVSDDALPMAAKPRAKQTNNNATTNNSAKVPRATLKRSQRRGSSATDADNGQREDDSLSSSSSTSSSSSAHGSSSEELSEVVIVGPSMRLQGSVQWPAATLPYASSGTDTDSGGGSDRKRAKSIAVAAASPPSSGLVCPRPAALEEAFPVEQWLAAIEMDAWE